tara:strand:+ start:329 stop:604 length:276 start_codon:yes stop_codon:yes gene_type:complete
MTKSEEKQYRDYQRKVREMEEKLWNMEVDEMVKNGEDDFVKEIGKILKNNFCGLLGRNVGCMFFRKVFMDLLTEHRSIVINHKYYGHKEIK